MSVKCILNYWLCLLFISPVLHAQKLKEGTYGAMLRTRGESALGVPFNFDVRYKHKKPVITIHNADERITVDEITIKGDSVNFKMPVFDTEFRTRLNGNDLEGLWINHYKTADNTVPFQATFGETRRFIFGPSSPTPDPSGPVAGPNFFEGKWETTFFSGSDSSKAIGVFHHVEQTDDVTGTFLTETGDYRYLEGIKYGTHLYLSCFDGNHAYLFVLNTNDGSTLDGIFFSGKKHYETVKARRNADFKLADAEAITFMKDKSAKLEFSFPDLDKKQVSLNDKQFRNKPVIIQIMGSWCPNCMDESIYFSELYRQYNGQGLEILALAFEKTTDFEKARSLLLRMKTRLKMSYGILVTQQSGREKASETLSALNKITAFPTTLFLNRQHQVVKVHTGFSGPATGNEYELYKKNTEAFIKQLLKE